MKINIKEFRDAVASSFGEGQLWEEIKKLSSEEEEIRVYRDEYDTKPIIIRQEDKGK